MSRIKLYATFVATLHTSFEMYEKNVKLNPDYLNVERNDACWCYINKYVFKQWPFD